MPSRSPSASIDIMGFNQGPQSNGSLSKGKEAVGFPSYLNSLKHEVSPHEDNVLKNKGGAQTIRENGVLNSRILVRGGNKVNNTKGMSRWINSSNGPTIRF